MLSLDKFLFPLLPRVVLVSHRSLHFVSDEFGVWACILRKATVVTVAPFSLPLPRPFELDSAVVKVSATRTTKPIQPNANNDVNEKPDCKAGKKKLIC